MKYILLIGILGQVLSGCAATELSNADKIAEANRLSRGQVNAPPFLLTIYSKQRTLDAPTVIYIEGDGDAWINRRRLSTDPTPSNPIALRLAALDSSPNVVYIARPCQFTPMENNPTCNGAYWSGKRLADEVIVSINSAVDQIVAANQSKGVHLVGYSGGGGVAALVAARRKDVLSLRTLAGNLDHKVFTDHHKVTPMKDSLNPASVSESLEHIPQLHLVGGDDEVVPRTIADSFAIFQKSRNCIRIEVIKGANHVKGWEDAWVYWVGKPASCLGN